MGGRIYAVYSTDESFDFKDNVVVATTEDITLNGSQTIDDVNIGDGYRVLVKDQTTASENGIYDASSSGAWSRSVDMSAGSNAAGAIIPVEMGINNGDKTFRCTTDSPNDIVGTNGLTFSVDSVESASNLSVDNSNLTSQSLSDIDIKSGGVGAVFFLHLTPPAGCWGEVSGVAASIKKQQQ